MGNSPVIIQFSNGGAAFLAGKGIKNTGEKAAILGAIAGAQHVRLMAKHYGVPVILHSDHCAKKLLPWFDGMLEADEEYFRSNGEPLFSSHMLDLSEEPLEENIAICKKYLERMAKVNLLLEMELGITGGEEDGVDNTDVDSSRLYTQPEEVWQVYEALSSVPNGNFTVAAAFGNVHGVYAPGNVLCSHRSCTTLRSSSRRNWLARATSLSLLFSTVVPVLLSKNSTLVLTTVLSRSTWTLTVNTLT